MPEVITTVETETVIIEDNDNVSIVEVESEPQLIEIGIAGPQGPQGPIGSGGTYRHVQGVASDHWIVQHNLGAYLNITFVDSAGNEQIGDTVYVSTDRIDGFFSGAFSGEAYVS